ncbi:MAG: hypothetical protein ACNA8P_04365 [Phycisphaerales bacterium]
MRISHRLIGLMSSAMMACLLLLAPAVSAQVFRPGGDLLQPGFTTQDLEHGAKLFGFDEMQRAIAEEMLEDYFARFAVGVEQMSLILRAAEREFQETRDVAIWNDFRDRSRAFEQRKDQITRVLLDDLRLILSPQQEALWPRYERDLRRMATIDEGGLVSGETVDLVALLDELGIESDERSAIAQVEDQYVTELDRALVRRNRVYEDTTDRAFERFSTEGFGDFDAVMEYFGKLLEDAMVEAVQVRDINLRYAGIIGRGLPYESGRKFQRRFNELCYPRVYRAGPTDRAFEAILAFDDLTEEQREQVLGQRERYEQSRERLDANWARAIATQEEERDVMRVMGIEPSTDATRAARTARRGLDRRAYEQVLLVLNEDQASRLPPPVMRDRGDD